MQSNWFWSAVVATNIVMTLVSRRLLKNLRSMKKIGQGPWIRSKSTLIPNMVSLEQHWIILFALRLPSNLKLKILLRIMKVWINK
jgi:hypothetical protein